MRTRPLALTSTTKTLLEAHGVKGMKSTPWRKTFASADALQAWCERHDAEVHALREVDAVEK